MAQKNGVKIVAPVRVNGVVQKSDGKLEVRTDKVSRDFNDVMTTRELFVQIKLFMLPMDTVDFI